MACARAAFIRHNRSAILLSSAAWLDRHECGGPPVIKAKLRASYPRAVQRLGELLDSADERVQLKAAKAIIDRHLGRPAAIQADLTVRWWFDRASPGVARGGTEEEDRADRSG
jgi:hypothetical protein